MCDCCYEQDQKAMDNFTKLQMIQAILEGQGVCYNMRVDGVIGQKEGIKRCFVVGCDLRPNKVGKRHAGKGHRKAKQN